jgi:hypothetical protein
MVAGCEERTSELYGEMDVSSAQQVGSPVNGRTTVVQQCYWRPDPRLLPGLGGGAAVGFRIRSYLGGNRRLMPCAGMDEYSRSATRIGLEILAHRYGLSLDQRQDYEMMLMLHRRLPATKAWLKRQFSSLTDLVVKPSGRGSDHLGTNVLPDNLGKTPDGRSRKWSVNRFIAEGQERVRKALSEGDLDGAAVTASLAAAKPRDAIAYGLMAAAELSPLDLNGDQIRRIMRLAMVDLGPQQPANHEDFLGWVTARLRALWNAHVADTNAEFNAWFQGGSSNLVKALANLSGHIGGRLPREDVEWALVELMSRSLWYAADCQNAFAQAVAQTLSPRLDPAEHSVFKQWYQPQEYLGGLTLPLILERNRLLRPVLRRIWLEPENRNFHGVLWRMLEFYTQMTAARRSADRNAKAKPRTTTRISTTEGDAEHSQREACELTKMLAVKGGLICHSNACRIRYDVENKPNAIEIRGVCGRHGRLNSIQLTMEDAREIISRSDSPMYRF